MILVSCNNFAFVLKIAGFLFKLIQWAVPITLILFCTLDLFKAFTSADEKAKKDAGSKIVKRLIYAIVIFLVPVLLRIIFRALGSAAPKGYGTDNSTTSWVDCFNQYF